MCSNFLPKLQRGMPQFCILFYANYTILATQRWGPWHHAPPHKYAPAWFESVLTSWFKVSCFISLRQQKSLKNCTLVKTTFQNFSLINELMCHPTKNLLLTIMILPCIIRSNSDISVLMLRRIYNKATSQ